MNIFIAVVLRNFEDEKDETDAEFDASLPISVKDIQVGVFSSHFREAVCWLQLRSPVDRFLVATCPFSSSCWCASSCFFDYPHTFGLSISCPFLFGLLLILVPCAVLLAHLVTLVTQ